MKFWSLLKKELRELMTLQALLGVVVSLVVFLLLGQVMGNVTKDLGRSAESYALSDQDQSDLSRQLIASLESSGLHANLLTGSDKFDLLQQASQSGQSAYLIIPQGFGAGIQAGQPQSIQMVSELTSFAMLSNLDPSASTAAEAMQASISSMLLNESAGGRDVAFLQNPVNMVDVTIANGQIEQVNASMLQGFATQQTIFIPIIVFLLITFASQLNASAIANEKGDKTLETLLSTPVSRTAVLGAKMCASGLLSLLMAGVYMFAFSGYMAGMMGGAADGATGEMASLTTSLQNLGLALNPVQYLLLGIQLFLTIMVALAASMILGALAKDVKSASSMMMPLVLCAMIPYLVTMFADVSALPLPAQILLYLIPFTHTFIGSANLMFGNTALFFGGMAYQAVLLVVVMAFAVRVFSTDRIFTMGFHFGKKRHGNTPAA